MKCVKLLAFIYTVFLAACSGRSGAQSYMVVSPLDFKEKIESDSNACIIDARTLREYNQGHIDGAHLIDWLETGDFKKQAAALDKDKTIYVYCRSGHRSAAAAKYLASQGFNVVDMDGGIIAWEGAGLPLVW